MSAEFDSIHLECKINGFWVDLTADAIKDSVRWGIGLQSNEITKRIGDNEYLDFELNNSQANSAGLIGYYSPGHTNVLSGWGIGIPVRLYFVYENVPFYKWYGWIAPQGINVIPGIYGPRRVGVQCEGWLARASRHILTGLEYTTDKDTWQAAKLVLGNVPFQPLNVVNEIPITTTFPTVFDTARENTTVVSELNKLATSEWGAIYTRGNGTDGQTLVINGLQSIVSNPVPASTIPVHNDDLTEELLLEDGTNVLLEDGTNILLEAAQNAQLDNEFMEGMTTTYGKEYCNKAIVNTYPREAAAASAVLWTLQEPLFIAAGLSYDGTVGGGYRDPNEPSKAVSGINMISPVSGTDYAAFQNEDGTGTDYTANLEVVLENGRYGTGDVKYRLKNTGASDFYVTLLQARGYAVKIDDPNIVEKRNDDGIGARGVFENKVDMKYHTGGSNTNASTAAARVLKDDETTIESLPIFANRNTMTMFCFLALEPGKRLKVTEDMNATDRAYTVVGYNAQITGKNHVIWTPIMRRSLYGSYNVEI